MTAEDDFQVGDVISMRGPSVPTTLEGCFWRVKAVATAEAVPRWRVYAAPALDDGRVSAHGTAVGRFGTLLA